MTLNGFDISNVNGSGIITRALGGDFVICKSTEGKSFVDPCYAGFMSRLRAAGKLTGSYHFAHWANSPTVEAAFYGAHNDRRDGEFEILDWEMYGGQAGCPAGTHGPWIAEFLAARPRCGLYTNADMMGKIIRSADAAQLKLIRSRVFWKATIGGADPGNAYGFDRGVSLWQYRDTQGIDEDRAFITPQQWRALANGNASAPLVEDDMFNDTDRQTLANNTNGVASVDNRTFLMAGQLNAIAASVAAIANDKDITPEQLTKIVNDAVANGPKATVDVTALAAALVPEIDGLDEQQLQDALTKALASVQFTGTLGEQGAA